MIEREFRSSSGARWIERSRSLSPPAYTWMKRRLARGLGFGVAVRIEDGRGRVLLVRMNPRTAWSRNWVTPGGGAEPMETPRHAILREIREETGVRVRELRLWKVYHETLRTRNDAGLVWHFLQYTARWASGRPHSLVPHEIVEARWFHRFPRRTEFRSDWLYPPGGRSRPKPAN